MFRAFPLHRPHPTLFLRPSCSKRRGTFVPSPATNHPFNYLCYSHASRDDPKDTPLTKEEQLLGYTSHQRQRMKALQILGLTEESFERCRAVMLSSLGPSAFGYNVDETAKSAARAEAEEGWTPGDKFNRKGPGQHFGGDGHHSNLLRMPTFGGSNNRCPCVHSTNCCVFCTSRRSTLCGNDRSKEASVPRKNERTGDKNLGNMVGYICT